jgi:hypothetical protein
VEVLDVRAVSQNFLTIQMEVARVDDTIYKLHDRLLRMEMFMDFCHRAHPEVLKEFLTIEHAKERVGAASEFIRGK